MRSIKYLLKSSIPTGARNGNTMDGLVIYNLERESVNVPNLFREAFATSAWCSCVIFMPGWLCEMLQKYVEF